MDRHLGLINFDCEPRVRNGDVTAACPERGDDPLSPKTWKDFPRQGSYMPESWTVDRAGNVSPVNDSNSFTIFAP